MLFIQSLKCTPMHPFGFFPSFRIQYTLFPSQAFPDLVSTSSRPAISDFSLARIDQLVTVTASEDTLTGLGLNDTNVLTIPGVRGVLMYQLGSSVLLIVCVIGPRELTGFT